MAGSERRCHGGGRTGEPTVRVDRSNLHPVLRQRAGFVGADDRGAAKRFDARQVTHERVSSGHAPGRHGHRQRHGGEQPLRHVRDDDADREDDADRRGQTDEPADDEHGQAERHRQCRNHAAQLGDLVLERSPHALARHPPVRHQGQDGGNPQQGGEEVRELTKETNRDWGFWKTLDTVGPELEPPLRRLCSRQACGGASHGGRRRIQGQLMKQHRVWVCPAEAM